MRMWMVDPRIMCTQHLLGEHVELHMFVGHIRLGRAMGNFVNYNLVETKSIQPRHEALVKEMKNRGFDHKSPMVYTDRLALGHVPPKSSLLELLKRCETCSKRYIQLAQRGDIASSKDEMKAAKGKKVKPVRPPKKKGVKK